MPYPEVVFKQGRGGLGRSLPGKDHYSGMLFYMPDADLPTGFATDDRNKTLYSLQDAEDLGIVRDFSDEVKASGGEVQITGTPSGGAGTDLVIEIGGVELGRYTMLSGDSETEIGQGLATDINNRETEHGYSASNTTTTVTDDTVVLTPPDGYGKKPEAETITYSDDANASITQFGATADAEGSFLAVMHYHISEFFRINPRGVLFLGIQSENSYDGTGIEELQTYAEYEIRQSMVFVSNESNGSLATSLVDATQAKIANLEADKAMHQSILCADIKGSSLTGLDDLSTLEDKYVTVTIGQDGENYGNLLMQALGYSITDGGALLGTVSNAAVHQCIANPDRFNIATDIVKVNNGVFDLTNGVEYETAGFANGDLVKNVNRTTKETLHTQRYVYEVKRRPLSGTYFVDSLTAISAGSDYATIENNRSIQKSIRLANEYILPYLAGELYLNDDGTLTQDTVDFYANEVDRALVDMQRAGEISGGQVLINPDQNVLATSELVISMEIQPVGVARRIKINVNFVINVS